MASTSIEIRTVSGLPTAVGWAGPRTLTIDRPSGAGGHGLGYSGGELLLLAVGGCYVNDVFREAAKRGIRVLDVRLDVCCDWGGEPVRAQNVRYSATVEADAPEEAILELMRATDTVAEIPNSLGLGATVVLAETHAVSRRKPGA